MTPSTTLKTSLACAAAVFVFACSTSADSVGQTFKKVKDSVVVIKTVSSGFAPTPQRQEVAMGGLGSGFIISEDGQVMTAAHVVQTADLIVVVLANGKEYPARVLSSSPAADVALIQIDDLIEKVPAVRLADSDKAEIGDEIMVIGAPYGATHTLTVGHLSARRGLNKARTGLVEIEFLQVDAAVNQGNSGGPVFNLDGEVIGIVSHIMSQSGGNEGLGFAASINMAKKILLESARIWSGVDFVMVDGEEAAALNLPQDAGLIVQKVARGSLGERLGLKGGTLRAEIEGAGVLLGGDVILEIQNLPITSDEKSIQKISVAFSELKSGDSIRVKVLRAGKILELKAGYYNKL